jgi:hypothetical protein
LVKKHNLPAATVVVMVTAVEAVAVMEVKKAVLLEVGEKVVVGSMQQWCGS